MIRDEMINDVVRCYFEGGDWKKCLRELTEEVRGKT